MPQTVALQADVLPVILQHVREHAEALVAPAERERYKLITPFPPSGADFPDFQEEELAFRDMPPDVVSASDDTIHAYEFFKRTDALYYDYSYGIKSGEFVLSNLCERFFGATKRGGDPAFNEPFDRMADAFKVRFARQTAGDIGNLPFKYTALSPIAWNTERFVLNASEIERLKQKTLALYEDLDADGLGFLAALIESVKAANYSSIEYELGAFDVIREWMDPRLFDSPNWEFPGGGRTLYGEGDPVFTENPLKLCFAQRFYLIRNYTGTPAPVPPPTPPEVRDHRTDRFVRRAGLDAGIGRARLHDRGIVAAPVMTLDATDVRRREVRNLLIHRRLSAAAHGVPTTVVTTAATPPPRAGFVWVAASGQIPGHWERERAGATHPVSDPPPPPPAKRGYKIAGLKCRLLPRTP
jgi:hypothetical protein